MSKRYDYRTDYKGFNKNQINSCLSILREQLLKNLGICESNVNDLSKRISYLENKQ